jgi:ABC-type Fe3+/spermidine/putrescine transport system ATPase subunit
MALLTVTGVSKTGKDTSWVANISFAQNNSEKIAIAGETGSGKSTLLKMIAGLEQPTQGEIRLNKERVEGPLEKLVPGHPLIAYLSQHFELRNNYRVHEILEYANQLPPATAHQLYAVCRVQHLVNRRTDELSGGEKQRIALARLLTTAPQLLLLDEPFSNLDPGHKRIMKSVIEDIGEKLGISCILVSHDGLDVLPWADRILVLKEGKLIQQGAPADIYRKPVNEYCAGLFGEYNILDRPLQQLFSSEAGNSTPGKRMLLRPEQLLITPQHKGSVPAVVRQVWYRGSDYLLQVAINQYLLLVLARSGEYVAGSTVYITIAPGQLYYL